MRIRVWITSLALAGLAVGHSTPANAIGCFTGGLAGAVAGHMAHHGVLGAIGGCIAGHEYNKHQQRDSARDERDQAYRPSSPRTDQRPAYGDRYQ